MFFVTFYVILSTEYKGGHHEAKNPLWIAILLALTCMGQEWGKNNQLAAYNNVKIRLLAEKYGFTFVDLYSPLMNLETGEIYPEYTTDGGHLTDRGYEVLTAQITPVLEALLGK